VSRLTVYPDTGPLVAQLDTADAREIAGALRNIGVRFERWHAARELSATDDDQAVMALYLADIERLKREGAYQSVDVVRCLPDNPKRDQMRAKFLSEHTHDEDEVRFFVEGAAMFYLRVADRIYMIRCERNDLIGVPAGIRHWFDMGPAPRFTAIRLFTTRNGWVASFTGDTIAARFPAFDHQAA
jgi:1,2-dihydroxy-3-keto-5-methylthiopentene dioxygenase